MNNTDEPKYYLWIAGYSGNYLYKVDGADDVYRRDKDKPNYTMILNKTIWANSHNEITTNPDRYKQISKEEANLICKEWWGYND